MVELPPVVLVHGAWHGAWCWGAVQAELDARGVPTLAVDVPGHGASTLPFTDLAGDAAHVANIVARAARPVVLVGHSYGGAVIGEAGGQGDVHSPFMSATTTVVDVIERVAQTAAVAVP
jgi:pimeloyl-ACP methyl ester carboxylesterase